MKNKDLILQSEASECGLACLAMILNHYGHTVDLTELRHKVNYPSNGASFRQLKEVSELINLESRALQADIDDLNGITFPCILHWSFNHFVVLTKIKRGKYVIFDPASGIRTLSKKDFSNYFTGVLLELTPAISFEKKKSANKLKLSYFLNDTKGLKRSVLQIVSLALMLEILALIMPLHLQFVIDEVLPTQDANLSVLLAIGFTLLLIIKIFISFIRNIFIIKITNTLIVALKGKLFSHLLRLPLSFFYKRHMGDIISRFSSLDQVQQLMTSSLVASVVDGLFAVLTLIAMYIYSPLLSMISISAVLIYLFYRLATVSSLREKTEEQIIYNAKENSHFMETIRGIQTIKLFEKENTRRNQWYSKLIDNVNKKIVIQNYEMNYELVKQGVFGFQTIAIIFLFFSLIEGGTFSIGMLFAFLAYQNRFNQASERLVDFYIEFKMIGLHYQRISDIALEKIDNTYIKRMETEERQGELNSLPLELLKGELRVEELSYKYSAISDNVFNKVNYIFQAGKSTVITGASGKGKTTFLKCLLKLLEPTDGNILLDGININNVRNYRSIVSSVMQDDQLLSGTIAENIAAFDSNIDMDLVRECANIACIKCDIERMPMKFNSLIGDMGSSLSGGQKQRIFIARALYAKPRILIMDEATSHLDKYNEQMITNNISNMKITRIFVAHRRESIESADFRFEL